VDQERGIKKHCSYMKPSIYYTAS